jgi:alkylation response protein AidB-like acyl-CoA dehydrogenase
MDNLTSEQLIIIETVERLCASEFGKYQTERHYNTVPRPLFESLSAIGLAGLSIPEEYGGLNASATTIAAVFETISRFDVSPAIFVSVHAMVSGLISRFGTPDQKSKLLPPLASGATLAAFALTEPQAGSDAQALKTEATSVDGGFVLKGNKCYITSAGFAELYLVFARSKDATGSGISAFLVPADTAGLSIGKPEKKMGADLSPIASLSPLARMGSHATLSISPYSTYASVHNLASYCGIFRDFNLWSPICIKNSKRRDFSR